MAVTTITKVGAFTNELATQINDNFTAVGSGGTFASPAISGTVTGGASYTAPTLTSPTITGTTTIGTGATITAPVLSGSVTGTYTLAGTPTITSPAITSATMTTPALGVATGTSLAVTGLVTSSSASAGIGYATGAGGTGTQGTNRTTTVVMSPNPCLSGSITLISAAGSATPASFSVTNSAVAATDTIIVNQKSGTDKYEIFVTAVGTGSFTLTSFTTGGTTTETPVFNFAVLKAVAS